MKFKKSARNMRKYITEKNFKKRTKYFSEFDPNLLSGNLDYMMFRFFKLCHKAKSYSRVLNRLKDKISDIEEHINEVKNILYTC